jgi:hypothetical protein
MELFFLMIQVLLVLEWVDQRITSLKSLFRINP